MLVRFALGSGRGIARGEVVLVSAGEEAKPLYVALRNAVLRGGGTTIRDYPPSGAAREALELASVEQLSTFHRAYYRGLAATIDHHVSILSTDDPFELEGVDPAKLLAGRRTVAPYRRWLDEEGGRGPLHLDARSLRHRRDGEGGTASRSSLLGADHRGVLPRRHRPDRALARDVRARSTGSSAGSTGSRSSGCTSRATASTSRFTIGPGRRWLGGSGRNIPSFEIFTSPDWRGTEGTVAFTEPLYRYGSLIDGVRLRFERGEVVEASAARNEELLQAMIASDPGRAASARSRSPTAG